MFDNGVGSNYQLADIILLALKRLKYSRSHCCVCCSTELLSFRTNINKVKIRSQQAIKVCLNTAKWQKVDVTEISKK